MAMILEFRAREARRCHRVRASESGQAIAAVTGGGDGGAWDAEATREGGGEIVLFTGVRYSRWEEPADAPAAGLTAEPVIG